MLFVMAMQVILYATSGFSQGPRVKQRNQDADVVDTVILVPTEDHARAMLARSYETQKKKH